MQFGAVYNTEDECILNDLPCAVQMLLLFKWFATDHCDQPFTKQICLLCCVTMPCSLMAGALSVAGRCLFCLSISVPYLTVSRPMRAPGCKNGPAPFPVRMSYKATKPGLVLFYILACFNCIVADYYYGPLFMYC